MALGLRRVSSERRISAVRKEDYLWAFVPDANCERPMLGNGAGFVVCKEIIALVVGGLPLFTELPRGVHLGYPIYSLCESLMR